MRILQLKISSPRKQSHFVKYNYYKALHTKLRTLKSSSPKDYWKFLNVKSKAKSSAVKVSLDDFVKHFQDLAKVHSCDSTDGDNFNVDHLVDVNNDDLNREISEDEVVKQMKKLKNNKAPGVDLILNELLKSSSAPLVETIVKLFNLVLDTGVIPSDWSIGMIKPLYKGKGSPESPDNYRGITLLSCVGKLFTAVLN